MKMLDKTAKDENSSVGLMVCRRYIEGQSKSRLRDITLDAAERASRCSRRFAKASVINKASGRAR
jgi:hypothetical protein